MKKAITYVLVIFLLVYASTYTLLASPKAEAWDVWKTYDNSSDTKVDHSLYQRFLNKYVIVPEDLSAPEKGIITVNYSGVSQADKASLTSYIDYMGTTIVSKLNRDEQKAYWINLYNALTIMLILDHYPVTSIRNIKPNIASFGPWDMHLIKVEGLEISLNDIEHRILRPLWKDPRIHFAVNCASTGCPDLQPVAFTRDNLETLLNKGAIDYINHQRGVMIKKNNLKLSSIFDWYYSDFAKTKKGVIDFLILYADTNLATALKKFKGSISYSYDWSLNEKK
ncbi:MAG: DUF547 domain-containing protein [Spirochaetales bacterium]|nr:DUF547 domain-containing protein [Spirochaetales bacterium]